MSVKRKVTVPCGSSPTRRVYGGEALIDGLEEP
jgi:hypothetical protein